MSMTARALVCVLATLVLGAGCGQSGTSDGTNNGAPGAKSSTRAVGDDDGVSADDASTPPEPPAGPAHEFTDPGGFKFSLALYGISSMTEVQGTAGATVVAPPGSFFAAFSGRLTNLQTDRPAPLNHFGLVKFIAFSRPATGKTQPAGVSNCDKNGMVGCEISAILVCVSADPGRPSARLGESAAQPMAIGASMIIRCYTTDPVKDVDVAQLRLFTTSELLARNGRWVEVPRPAR